MFNKVIFVLLMLVLTASYTKAQTSKAFFESIIKNEDVEQKTPVILPHVEPADVLWAKTVWREVLLKEKMNLPLYYPTTPMDGRMSLIDLLLQGIEKSFKTAYDDDELSAPITLEEIKERFDARTDTMSRRNSETGEMETKIVSGEIHTDEVKRLRVKEVWFFNKRSSKMEVRIIALAPIREYVKEDSYDGVLKKVLFWVDYGEFRDLFAKQKVFNFQNDAVRLSMDDIFLKRFFNSRIYKEANVYNNREINSYSNGMDVVLESDKIKKEIFDKEQDYWQY